MKRLFWIALLALALPAVAQPTEFSFNEDYLARAGMGDLPITAIVEPAGWNVVEYMRVNHDGNLSQIPMGGQLVTIVAASCECGNVTIDGSRLILGADVAAGTHVVRLTRNFGETSSLDMSLAIHRGEAARMVVYLPNEYAVLTDAWQTSGGLVCTTAPCTIEEYTFSGNLNMLVVPAAFAPEAGTDNDNGDALLDEYGLALLGILLGAAIWSYLVKSGYVQKRRSQEVKVAAHVEAATTESKDILTARKRVLMAGLKELEKAKMGKEIDTDVYDSLKAQLKKETVTVMRAIEHSE